MSRTVRTVPDKSFYLRSMRHLAYRKSESSAIQQFIENGIVHFSNRLRGFKTRIVNPWDDYPISALRQIPTSLQEKGMKKKHVLNKKRNPNFYFLEQTD